MGNKTFLMDDKLHHQFKLYCIKRKVTMGQAIEVAIRIILKKDKLKTGGGKQ